MRDVGARAGKYYSVNFPLASGIDDDSYLSVFKPVIAKIMSVYDPGAVVLQCGADSLTADRLGCFNLTLKGHAECVRFMKSFGVPTLVLGGDEAFGRHEPREAGDDLVAPRENARIGRRKGYGGHGLARGSG